MLRFIARLVLNAFAIWLTFQIVPGLSAETASIWTWLIVAIIFGVVNALVRPIVLFLSCPLVLLTLGLFVLIINTIMLSLTIWLSNLLNLGLSSTGFWATFFGAIVLAIASWVISLILADRSD